jgi:hypothetical protein
VGLLESWAPDLVRCGRLTEHAAVLLHAVVRSGG